MAPSQKAIEECAQALKDKFPRPSDGDGDAAAAEYGAHFFSDDLYHRFAVEYDGHAEKASAALEQCLEWRRTYRPHEIDAATECPSALSSTFINLGGTDRTGAAVMVLTLAHPSVKEVGKEERVRLFMWAMEELSRRGREYFVLISDFSLVGKEKDPNGAATRDETTQMIDLYHPGRMRLSFMYNPPWFISSFAPLSTAFMSAKLKARVRTNCKTKDLLKEIDAEQLSTQCGGKLPPAANIIEGTESYSIMKQ